MIALLDVPRLAHSAMPDFVNWPCMSKCKAAVPQCHKNLQIYKAELAPKETAAYACLVYLRLLRMAVTLPSKLDPAVNGASVPVYYMDAS
jgi:hypothetical protein